jgi:hypothetical protein
VRVENFDTGHPLPRIHCPRRSGRLVLEAQVSSKTVGGHSYKVQIFNASPLGCKIEFVERPQLHDHILVKFDGLEPLGAAVCWVDGFVGGVEFDRPMHTAVFSSLVERLRPR